MKRFEVKDANGNTVSTRNSIQFAKSDAAKVEGATVYEIAPVVNGMGKKAYTWKFPVAS